MTTYRAYFTFIFDLEVDAILKNRVVVNIFFVGIFRTLWYFQPIVCDSSEKYECVRGTSVPKLTTPTTCFGSV